MKEDYEQQQLEQIEARDSKVKEVDYEKKIAELESQLAAKQKVSDND